METNLFQAIILGIVQGLTEFLPISSSGHLVLAPYFFGWEDPGLTFNVALHFGTLIAVVAFFWKDIVDIVKSAFLHRMSDHNVKGSSTNYPSNMHWLLVQATIPGILAGYFFNDYAETIFRHPLLIASTLALFGLLLFLADKWSKKYRMVGELNHIDAAVVGLAQAMAIIPGVSRSGITITAGLIQGLDREAAAKLSFLMSVPVIFGATVHEAGGFFHSSVGMVEIAGIISAAISGYLAIVGLIKFIQKSGYQVFFWYRLALALLIVAVWMLM